MTQPVEHAGRLELTWTNKDKALWMPDPADLKEKECPYQWVEKDDPRVLEVRPLQYVNTVGETSDNLLIQGDSLEALKTITTDPLWAKKLVGKVKLIYIDPPFNTGQAFEQYDDALDHSVWLSMMAERLRLLTKLLSPDGTIWVHLDDGEAHRSRVLLDEVLGASAFIGTTIWQKSDSPRNSARHFSTDHDYIHVYAKDAESWRPNRLPRTAGVDSKYTNPDDDPRGRWFGDNLRANKFYSLGQYSVVGPTGKTFTVPKGRYWRVSKDSFEKMDADNRISWGTNDDAFPTMKRFLSEVSDLVPRTLWFHKDVGSNRTSKNEIKKLFPGVDPFATPKPEKLLQRVLQTATDPGDLVLDCFAGSGTTAAVAHKMGRRWVAMEREESTMRAFTLPRLSQVVDGSDEGGITSQKHEEFEGEVPDGAEAKDAKVAAKFIQAVYDSGRLDELLRKTLTDSDDEFRTDSENFMRALKSEVGKTNKTTEVVWEGGGGFQLLSVSAPIWELDSDGDPVLKEGVSDEAFTEAVRVQLGFAMLEDRDGFSGRRGRQMLGVVMGLVDEREVRQFASRLREGERALIVATAVTPEAQLLLKELSKGSKLIKAPDDLFAKFGRVIR